MKKVYITPQMKVIKCTFAPILCGSFESINVNTSEEFKEDEDVID